MSMNFALGLAFGQKLAESAGVADPGARRRAGIVLGAVGVTPVGLLITKTIVDRQAEAERKLKDDNADNEVDAGGGKRPPSRGSSVEASSGSPAADSAKTKPS